MKKLMLAVAIVCAAAYAQAASVTWSSKNIYNGSESAGLVADGSLAYVFGGSYTTAAITAALNGAGANGINAWLAGVTPKYSTTVAGGKVADTTGKIDPTTVGLTVDGTAQDLFLLVFNTSSVTDDSKFFVTSANAEVAISGNTLFMFGNLKNATTAEGGWGSSSSIPEPTSGLLLLLGMAGLALKRKCA